MSINSKPSRSSGVSFHAGASGDDKVSGQTPQFWLRWLTYTPPAELGETLARMIEDFPVEGLIQRTLYEILLGRHDVAERRAGEASSAEKELSRQELHSRASELLLHAFSRNELDMFARKHLDVRLDHLVTHGASQSELVVTLLQWAERRGRLVELLQAAAKERPTKRRDLADLVRAVEASQTP